MKAPEGYEELKSGLAVLPADPEAGLLEVKGPEAEKFLQAMLSQQLQGLTPGQGRESAVLDREGRILANFLVLKSEQGYWLRVEEGRAAVLKAHLERFRIAAKVDFIDPGFELRAWGGPGAAAFLAEALRLDKLPASGPAFLERPGGGLLIRWDRLGFPHWEVWAPPGKNPEFEASRSLVQAGPEAMLAWRIENLRPYFHADIKGLIPNDLPQLETLVSFAKGCFPGQEVVVRIKHRGQPAHRLVQLRINMEKAPDPGSALSQEGQEVGKVMAAGPSPALGGMAALALVRRLAGKPGQKLELPGGIAAEVIR